ncbi:MAG: DUF2085 domain-containing protein [Anaerolineaceae bacterium]|nr:MAG: DUF2085 domain-containing protein [Anaerolineaceae bacterium]
MLTVTLYTRKSCGLCDEAKAELAALETEFPHRLAEVDIESDPALLKRYLTAIPVLEIGPYTLHAPITKEQLRMTLGAAIDRRGQLEKVGSSAYEARVRRGQEITTSDRISNWISKHYLLLLNLFMALYVGLPFLAPTLMKAGVEVPARVIYTMYSPLCHQFGFRSFFLYGEQLVYPLEEAGLSDIKSFDDITGWTDLSNPYSPERLQARQFVGDEHTGYKVALCERDVAIYGGLLLFGLVFGLTKRRIPPLHWALWLFIGLGPIGLDGFSQLFSQFELPWLMQIVAYRESTPFLRVLTGLLFGISTAWFAYPYIEESMAETRQFFIKKLAVAK